MNSIHDMGGMEGFGPINPELNDHCFHEDWEKRVFGMFIGLFAGGAFNLDEFRHSQERMGNRHYLEGSYYEHWLEAFQTLLDEAGTITRAEIEQRMDELLEEAS